MWDCPKCLSLEVSPQNGDIAHWHCDRCDLHYNPFNPSEPPSQQYKQTVDGEQVDDGRVVAGKLILPVGVANQINIG